MRSYHPTVGLLLTLAAVQAGVLSAETPESGGVTLQVSGAPPAGEAFISDDSAELRVLAPPSAWMRVRHVQFDMELPPAPQPVQTLAPPEPVAAESPASEAAPLPALEDPTDGIEEAAEGPIVSEVAPVAEIDSPPAPPEGVVLTLLDLEEMALESNPTLVQARMAIRAAEGRRLQAGLYRNPTIGYIGDEIGNEGAGGVHGMSFSQEIITADKRRLSRSVAGHAIEEARWSWEVQRHRVMNDIRIAYVDVALAQQTIDINKEFVRIGQENVDRTKAGYEVQQLALIDLLQARNEAERANLSLGEAEGDHRRIWNRLAIAIGRQGMPPERLAFHLDIGTILGSVPELDQDACLARLLAESPEVARARAGQQRAHCEVARQCALRTPNFEISTGVKYDDSTGDTMADFGVSMPLQLFDRNQGRIMEAQAELIRARKEVDRIEMDLSQRLITAFAQYANARRRVESYHATILPNSQSLFEKTENAFKRQQIRYLDVMVAQRTHFGNRLDYLISVRELLARRVEIEGLLLTGGLTTGK